MQKLSIGDVAQRAGIRPSAIRYYESVGLLPAPERVGGQRRYDAAILDRLAVIALAQQAGFTIDETRTFIYGFAAETPPSARWRAMAERKLPEIEALISRASTMKRILHSGLRCECITLEECARESACAALATEGAAVR